MKTAEFRPPAIFFHRCIGFEGGENTLTAAKNALAFREKVRKEKKGVRMGMEMDVGLTGDPEPVPVLLHDGTLTRTTTGTGALRKTLYEDLLKLSAGKELGTYQTEIVPHLKEFLTLYTAVEKFAAGAPHPLGDQLILDLKDQDPTDLIILKAVKEAGLLEQTLFSSEYLNAIVAIKEAEPNARIGLATETWDVHAAIPGYARAGVDYLSSSASTTTEKVLDTCDEYGLEKYPWFHGYQTNWPRARAYINKLAPRVDGIITNHVRETVELFYGPLAA
jgi:glycerophosphoryl diester phosphodiesterase